MHRSLQGYRSLIARSVVIFVPALLFLLLSLVVYRQLFSLPLIEFGDQAANSIQVQNAKHFHELLGNYSRWHFHHPGPFFFYLFAAGEAVFYSLLHLVPAPHNAQYLVQIGFNTVCIFLAIYVFYSHIRRPLFPALAILVSVLFLYVLCAGVPQAPEAPIWPPYAAIFAFLLLLTSSASVASGRWDHTPLLAFSGMVMVHDHVAQVFFVVVLGTASLGFALIRERSRGDLPRVFRVYRWSLVAALAIFSIFALPIVIDYFTNHPNNIHQIRLYLRQHHGEHNSLPKTLLYVASFFTYFNQPEIALAKATPHLKDVLNPALPVRLYWLIVLCIAALAVLVRVRTNRGISLFVKVGFAEVGIVTLLFLYWSWRITGPMFTFNGFFFFSVQLFGLLLLCGVLAAGARISLKRSTSVMLACAATLPLPFAVTLKGLPSDTEIPIIFNRLPKLERKSVEITMPADQSIWPTGAALARYIQRRGGSFCFGQEWAFMFGDVHVCRTRELTYHVCLAETLPACNAACKVLYRRTGLFVAGVPNSKLLILPAIVNAGDCMHEARGFNALEKSGEWSTDQSSISFELPHDPGQADHVQLAIEGSMFPGRPVEVSLNSKLLGWIRTPGQSTAKFEAGPRQILWGAANTIEFVVPNAGPVGGDMRTLGYFFQDLVISQRKH